MTLERQHDDDREEPLRYGEPEQVDVNHLGTAHVFSNFVQPFEAEISVVREPQPRDSLFSPDKFGIFSQLL
jgi:hypothetical protein